MLQIVIYKKLNFWEEYTPLTSGLRKALVNVVHSNLADIKIFGKGLTLVQALGSRGDRSLLIG